MQTSTTAAIKEMTPEEIVAHAKSIIGEFPATESYRGQRDLLHEYRQCKREYLEQTGNELPE